MPGMSSLTVQELRDLGNKKFRELNYGAALMRYTEAIDKDPSNYALYYNRAVTLVKMDAIDEAIEDLLKSLELNAEYIPSLCQLGFLYLYKGDTPSSLETYVKVVKANEKLPHSLSKFKAQLKQSISLAESRCLQQEYSQSFIDKIITPDVRTIIESYPTLPNHMIESGIPPVSFGNVPVAHIQESTAIVTGASIPVPLIFGNTTQQAAQNNARGLNIGEIFSAVSRYVPPPPAGEPTGSDATAPTAARPAPAAATTAAAAAQPAVAEQDTHARPVTTQTRITTVPSTVVNPLRHVIRTTMIPGSTRTQTGQTGQTGQAGQAGQTGQTAPRSAWDIHQEALQRATELRNQVLERNRTRTTAATTAGATPAPATTPQSEAANSPAAPAANMNVTSNAAAPTQQEEDDLQHELDSFDLD